MAISGDDGKLLFLCVKDYPDSSRAILIKTMLLPMDPERILKLLTRRTLSQVYKMNESN